VQLACAPGFVVSGALRVLCVAWDYDRVVREFLGDNKIDVAPAVVVEAFQRAERLLGSAWIESGMRADAGIGPRGTNSTLRVVATGQKLAYVEGTAGVDKLVGGLRSDSSSAAVELTAIYLLRSRVPLEIDLGSRCCCSPVSTTSDCRRGTRPSMPVSSSTPSWRCSPAPGTFPGSTIPRGSRGRSRPFSADRVEQQRRGHRRPVGADHAGHGARSFGGFGGQRRPERG